MVRNILKTAFRNLLKHRGYSLINIAGLAVGLAATLLILVYVQYELSYDRSFSKQDRIYRVVRDFLNQDGAVNLQLSHLAPGFTSILKEEFPEIETVARLYHSGTWAMQQGETKLIRDDVSFVDPEVLDMFDIALLAGDRETALHDPFTLLLSQTAAYELFGDVDPLGKSVLVDGEYSLQVTGVYADPQQNTVWHHNVLVSYSTMERYATENFGPEYMSDQNFGSNNTVHWVLLKEGVDAEELEAKFDGVLDQRMPTHQLEDGTILSASDWTHLYLQPLASIHLHSHRDTEISPTSNIQFVLLLIVVAIFILVLACVNFMNLATARSAGRAREVGLRKVVGARRESLIAQFLGESFLITFAATILAIGLVEVMLPYFSNFVGLSGTLSLLGNSSMLPLILLVFLVTSVVSGLYPAFYLSAFQPMRILRGELTRGRAGARLRRSLVVFQFVISVTLIIGVGAVYHQMQYIRNTDLGFNRDHVVIYGTNIALQEHWREFKPRIKALPGIIAVTRASRLPSGRLLDFSNGAIEGPDGEMKPLTSRLANVRVEHDYFDVFGMELVAGRDFSPDRSTDSTEAFVLNESALERFELGTPDEVIGRKILYSGREGTVIGVVKDAHMESLHQPISPVVFHFGESENSYGRIAVRFAPGNLTGTLDSLRELWLEYEQTFPFDVTFLDDRVEQQYHSENQLMTLFGVFSLFAVFVATLGLLGLASYTAERRTREIGIRRTLGASEGSIVKLLTGEFALLVLLANLIAWPLAWFGMNKWLETFAYKAGLSMMTFVMASLLTFIVAFLTVATQALRATRSNPVDALRSE